MAPRRIYLFGVPRVELAGQALAISRRKTIALLAYLTIRPQPHSRDLLATLLWPEHDQTGARANLRRDLSRLKSALGDDLLLIDRAQVGLNPDADCWLDVRAFRECGDHLRQHTRQQAQTHFPHQPCPDCLSACETAVTLYTADFMAGFSLSDSPQFDEWQFFQTESLRRELAHILQTLIQWHNREGQFERSILYARRWLALDALHEPAHRQLMQLYAWTNQQPAALRQYEECARLLAEEMGVEPEKETTDLYQAIRARQITPPTRRAVPDPAPPERLRFVRGDLLAVGGHGELYHGHDQQTNRPVVIKRLKAELMRGSADYLARFQREGEILDRLNHPNIVRMLAVYQIEEQPHIVMEYVPGGSLRQLLDEQTRLPVPQAVGIALELADALSRAHHLGIIHRDIKPANILLAEDGTPRLTDFGIARLDTVDVRLTQSGSVLGTPAYLSPEAINGEPVDARSDIWSLGAVLYEMLTGAPPFDSDHLAVILSKILNDPLPNVQNLRPDVPESLAYLLAAMLSRDRQERPTSMRQVAAALEAIRNGRIPTHTTLPKPASAPTPTPTATPSATPSTPTNLPKPSTTLIGRNDELHHIQHLLRHEADCRLLTLLGPGGSGKTRLALEAGRQLLPAYPDGVYFISLVGVTAADFIIPTIAMALDFQFSGATTPKSHLLHHLRDKKLLLILDNFEHLLEGAELLADALHVAPMLHLLVTSRERLRLQQEWVLDVPGLALPPAAQLFLQRARRADATFSLTTAVAQSVTEICHLLHGLPLALELAAPWLGSLSADEIAAVLRQHLEKPEVAASDAPEWLPGMVAIFAQTWQALSPVETAVLQKMALFQGGGQREAAQHVAGATRPTLAALRDKALLHRTPDGRYHLHELVRQWAKERLHANPVAATEAEMRHSAYYLDFLAQRTAALKDGRQRAALSEIAAEIDNVRAAWRYGVQQGHLPALTAAAECFWLFCDFQGMLHEGELAFGQALAELTAVAPTTPAMHTLIGFLQAGQGSLIARRGWFEEGWALLTRGLEQMRRAQPVDRQKEAFVLAWAAFVLVQKGRFVEVNGYAQNALDTATAVGDEWLQAGCRLMLGAAELFSGQLDEAEKHLHTCLEACQAIGERRIRLYAMSYLALIGQLRGDFAHARQLLEQALELSRQLDDRLSRAALLSDVARLVLLLGQVERAIKRVDESQRIFRAIGRGDSGAALWVLGGARRLQGDFAEAERLLLNGLAVAKAAEHQPDLAACLTEMARLVRDQGRLPLARQVLQEALDVWQAVGSEPEMAGVWRELGHTAALVEPPATAVAHEAYMKALEVAYRHGLAPYALDIMVGLARLMEPDEQPRALELLALAERHPASSFWTQSWAGSFLRRMPEAAVTAVRARTDLPTWQEMALTLLPQLQPEAPDAPLALPTASALSPFVGRERELAEISRLLTDDPECRLLTIVGPGGIGKTRLALAVATAVAPHFIQGVYHVSLACLDSSDQIITTMAESLGFHNFTAGEPKQLVLDFLCGKRALLVLDNFEHLLDGAALVGEILVAAPETKILTTSRERLNLQGEVVCALNGLDCPDEHTLDVAATSAGQMLLSYAHQARPDYQFQPEDRAAIVRICRLVQGMPLALVLAAGWLDMLSFSEVADEIARCLDFLESERRDIPERQRSVRAVFDSSWQRLNPESQAAFAGLTIFRGGFTRAAAQQVAGAGLRTLRTLVDSSFVHVMPGGRYEIHELLRQYGLEHLASSGRRESSRDAHSAYYLNEVQQWESEVKGQRQATALTAIETDLENVRSAWNWAVAQGDAEGIGRALEGLHVFCDLRGRYQDGAHFFAPAVARFAPASASEAGSLLWGRLLLRFAFLRVFTPSVWEQAKAELATAVTILQQYDALEEQMIATFATATYRLFAEHDAGTALSAYERSLHLSEALEETYYRVGILLGIGSCWGTLGDAAAAEQYTRQAIALAKTNGNKVTGSIGLANLAESLLGNGDYAEAEQHWQEAATLGQETDNPPVVSYSQAMLGFVAFLRGESVAPETTVRDSLSLAEKISYSISSAYAGAVLSLWTAVKGDGRNARSLAENSLANPTNNTLGLVMAHWGLCLAWIIQEQWAAARQALGDALRQAAALGMAAPLVWLLPVGAVLAAQAGQHTLAAELLALAEHHPLHLGGWLARWPLLAEMQAVWQRELGDVALAAAVARGKAMEVETAVAALLAQLEIGD
jgi:predicted ATPase/serine/threonine protein kinase/DNA-binding SARP family transcriptional activator